MSRWEQNAVFETSECICLVKRINGVVAQKTIESELVRCRECKWCDDGNGANQALACRNEYIDIDCHPDFYCGYGERESE